MAAPVASYLRLADDSPFTGKKVRTQTRTVGSDSVHEHYYQLQRKARVLGVHRAALTQATISATAQDGVSTTQGFLWAHMPSAVSGVKARIRAILVTTHLSSTLVASSAPRIRADRFTFTGTATGSPVVGVRNSTSGPAAPYPMLDLRTNMTGLTVSLANQLGNVAVGGDCSAVSAFAPAQTNHGDILSMGGAAADEDEWIILAAGEGVVVYQDVVGTTADTRKLNLGLVWDEIDVS